MLRKALKDGVTTTAGYMSISTEDIPTVVSTVIASNIRKASDQQHQNPRRRIIALLYMPKFCTAFFSSCFLI